MVQRQFAAFDNEAFTADASSPNMTLGFEYQSIILEDASSEPDVFNDDDEGNHVITEGRGIVANGTEVESESYHHVRAIDEATGLIKVEDLRVGMRVMTRDNGLQELRWIGRKDLTAAKLDAEARFRPIRIRAGALSDGMPMHDNDSVPKPPHSDHRTAIGRELWRRRDAGGSQAPRRHARDRGHGSAKRQLSTPAVRSPRSADGGCRLDRKLPAR